MSISGAKSRKADNINYEQARGGGPYSSYFEESIQMNGAIPIRNRINGRTISKLPNIIWQYRNARESSVGYDEPTYFGFFIDIHSRNTDADNMINPFTSGRANPLFYYPNNDPGNPNEYGKMSVINDGKNTEYNETLGKFINEASAIQYINHFSADLAFTPDEYYAKELLFTKAADEQMKNFKLKPNSNEINRAYYLVNFKSLLNLIQDRTPWTFKEIDGINSLWSSTFGNKAASVTEQNPEIVLSITCDESVDLRVNKLAYYYKMLAYDSFNKRKVLPHNLEEFSMDVYFMDLRYINKLGSDGSIDQDFKNQINFGGVAFRCYGCTFDFSGMHDGYASQVKSTTDTNEHMPKFKIKVSRVLPATYFGKDSFGEGFDTNNVGSLEPAQRFRPEERDAFDGGFDLGPFTGGVTRVLTQVQTAATNLINQPIAALNDAVAGIQRRFEDAVSAGLARNGVQTNPYGKKTAEELLGSRKGDSSKSDIFPGQDKRTSNPINNDVFPATLPGVNLQGPQIVIKQMDNVFPKNTASNLAPILDDVFSDPTPPNTAPPIGKDIFPGSDIRTAAPITTDVFPGQDTRTAAALTGDVFPGQDTRTAAALTGDVFPGQLEIESNPIKNDVFEGSDKRTGPSIQTEIFPKKAQGSEKPIQSDVFPGALNIDSVQGIANTFGKTSVETTVNQRRGGGRISNKNPFK